MSDEVAVSAFLSVSKSSNSWKFDNGILITILERSHIEYFIDFKAQKYMKGDRQVYLFFKSYGEVKTTRNYSYGALGQVTTGENLPRLYENLRDLKAKQ